LLCGFLMRPSKLLVLAICLLWSSAVAPASPATTSLSHLSGRVLDSKLGTPVERVLVVISGPTSKQTMTDSTGRYFIDLPVGTYDVTLVYGNERKVQHVDIVAGRATQIESRIDSKSGEVIVIHDRIRPPVPPKATNFKPRKAPPYSDRAIVSDAWTRAWMLLDIDEAGRVLRMKWLKRPGYDLDPIAISEIKKLHFTPARDASGRAIRAYLVWGIEWPSAWWLSKFVGTRSAMPPIVGYPPRRLDSHVPCKGSGPMHLGSMAPGYKDCSKPDLRVAEREKWFVP